MEASFWISLILCLSITIALTCWGSINARKAKNRMPDRLIHKNCKQKKGWALCGSDLSIKRTKSEVICIVCDDLSLMYETGTGACPICGTHCMDAKDRR